MVGGIQCFLIWLRYPAHHTVPGRAIPASQAAPQPRQRFGQKRKAEGTHSYCTVNLTTWQVVALRLQQVVEDCNASCTCWLPRSRSAPKKLQLCGASTSIKLNNLPRTYSHCSLVFVTKINIVSIACTLVAFSIHYSPTSHHSNCLPNCVKAPC